MGIKTKKVVEKKEEQVLEMPKPQNKLISHSEVPRAPGSDMGGNTGDMSNKSDRSKRRPPSPRARGSDSGFMPMDNQFEGL